MNKTIYVLSLSLFAFVACNKDEEMQQEQTLNESANLKASKIMVCHFAKSDGTYEVLLVNENSQDNHLNHGDAVDMDGDGFFDKANGCSETDCDDTTYSETNSCCIVITPLTDANIITAANLWFWDQASAIATYGDISTWCTSNVTKMTRLFLNRASFNQDISAWDVSNVTDMYNMFAYATSFNQDLSTWNVSNVINCSDFSTGATAWALPIPNFTNCTP